MPKVEKSEQKLMTVVLQIPNLDIICQKFPKYTKSCPKSSKDAKILQQIEKSCLKNQNAVNGLHDDMMTWSQDYLMT